MGCPTLIMSIRIESIDLASTSVYLSIQQGSGSAAETGLEETRVIRFSGFLLDWFDGAESTERARVHGIDGAREESSDELRGA